MSKKDKKKSLKSYNKRTLIKFVLDLFRDNPGKQFNYKQVSKRLGVKDILTKQLISTVLSDLTKDEVLEEIYTGKFRYIFKASYVTGLIDMSEKGKAYLIADETEEKIFIPQSSLNRALHGDQVKIYLYAHRKKQEGQEGEVVEIIERAKTTFVGKIELSKQFAFIDVAGRTMPYDIFVPLENTLNAKNGDKVIARIVEWPENAKNPIGEVVEVLGKPGNNEVEMHAILAEYELPLRFPKRIEDEAGKISELITEQEILKRRDFRKVLTITIDPEDAKDFDDALSLRKLENGNWQVGVHIADVTHFVEADSVLDKEALERGTSVYLVDRVVPMLPERLSNFICSLRPNEDKLTFSAVFELNEEAEVVDEWFGKTIIRSARRFNYDEVLKILEAGSGELYEELSLLNNLARKLRTKREKNGAVNFDRTEVKFHIDDNGKPLDVFFKSSTLATQLIEEFMLLANKKVAEYIGLPKPGKKERTFVYRIHDEPDLEKLASFAKFIKRFGYSIKTGSNKEISSSMNLLIATVNGKSEQDIIENLAIRSMAKAIYSTKNIGHYGLAFSHYTHFTSPIRRYPDMLSHRLLDRYLANGSSVNQTKYEKMCKQSSEMEQRAANAERASVKYKQVEFMQDKLGFIYEGVISGVTDWGIYVEIVENKIEGMISLKDLDDDYYVFDEKNYCIVGRHKKKRYQLGDKVKIQIVRTNIERKQLDFVLV